MKRNKRISAIALGVGLAIACAAGPAAAADRSIEVIVANCAVCHGPNGKTAGHTPRLNNLTEEKIQEALTMFAKGDKAATIMDRISKGFTPEQVKAIAAHIGNANKTQ